jgi:hypothetical protein
MEGQSSAGKRFCAEPLAIEEIILYNNDSILKSPKDIEIKEDIKCFIQ